MKNLNGIWIDRKYIISKIDSNDLFCLKTIIKLKESPEINVFLVEIE